MSTIEVDKIIPQSGTTLTVGEAGDSLTFQNDVIPNAALANDQITINGSAVSLGGSITIVTITRPTFTSVTPATIPPSAATAVTIAGSGFQSVPVVEAINSSTGAITRASSVSFSSASSITANFTLSVQGTYFIRIENNDGGAVRSGAASLAVSTAPTFTTAAGSLGTFSKASSISVPIVATSNSNVTITETTAVLTSNANTPASTMNLTLTGSPATTATYTIGGTTPSPTSTTAYQFTLRASDVEGQTVDRAFSITISPNYFGDGSDGALNTTP